MREKISLQPVPSALQERRRGSTREAYEECFHRIEEQVARIAPIIIGEARARELADSDSRERRNR